MLCRALVQAAKKFDVGCWHRAQSKHAALLWTQVIITQNPEAEPSDEVLPVSYPKFTSMCQEGDMIFIGRYLVTGSEDSSLYVKVSLGMPLHDITRCFEPCTVVPIIS